MVLMSSLAAGRGSRSKPEIMRQELFSDDLKDNTSGDGLREKQAQGDIQREEYVPQRDFEQSCSYKTLEQGKTVFPGAHWNISKERSGFGRRFSCEEIKPHVREIHRRSSVMSELSLSTFRCNTLDMYKSSPQPFHYTDQCNQIRSGQWVDTRFAGHNKLRSHGHLLHNSGVASSTNLSAIENLHEHHSKSFVADGGEQYYPRKLQTVSSNHSIFSVVGTDRPGPKPGQISRKQDFNEGCSLQENGDLTVPEFTSKSSISFGYFSLGHNKQDFTSGDRSSNCPGETSDMCQRTESPGYIDSLRTGGRSRNKINATRSNSVPMKLSSQLYMEVSSQYRRQSLQSFYTKPPVDSFTLDNSRNHHTSEDSSVCIDSSVSGYNVRGVSPRRCNSCGQQMNRTLSYNTDSREFKYPITKSYSHGEIDTDYVTLDRRYEARSNRLCPVTEVVILSTESTVNCMSPVTFSSGYAKQLDSTPVTSVNFGSAGLSVASSKVYAHGSSMNGPVTNIVSDPKAISRREDSSDQHLLAETNGSQRSSRTSYVGRGDSGYSESVITMEADQCLQNKNEEVRPMKRSQSLPDLQVDDIKKTLINRNYSDDEDGDDFGFLSYPISFLSSSSTSHAAMNKAKSPSPGKRIFPKRWRSKTKALPAVSTSLPMWTPGPPGSCLWSSVSGRKVQLRPVSIMNLTEAERLALQKIALIKLQTMNIGCPVSIPNENSDTRTKKSALSLKRRSKSVSSSAAADTWMKDGTSSGLVFGIPLIKCLMNDRELEKKQRRMAAASSGSTSPVKIRISSSDNLQTSRATRKSSSSSQGSLDGGSGIPSHHAEASSSHKRSASSDSLSESEGSSSVIDALSLSASNPASRLNSLALEGSHTANQAETQVPNVVKACFRHIETYGLQTLGIFRVGSSKKRVKQLREEFDCGSSVQLTDEHNPHDVGALLKEYFRDLPDPLLTRELYLPFLHAERMKDEHLKHSALRLLICMLPVVNRDTLWALLRFLATVSQHAVDSADEKGATVSGNKMDAHNLATLFGPNILHRTKAVSDKQLMSESAERVGQCKEVIEVVKDMIDNHHELFEISGSLRDDVLRLLMESDQEIVDKILRHIANQNQIETDPESMCSVFEDTFNSPTLHHSINSDADLLAYAQKQTVSSHRPLRVTKSADDSLDSPLPKSRAPHLSDPQTYSPVLKDNYNKAVPFNTVPSAQVQFNTGHTYPSPVPNRNPVLRVCLDSTNPGQVPLIRPSMGSHEKQYGEGFRKSLNIPQPHYFRKNSASSVSSGLSSLNGHGEYEGGHHGQWILPTPPTSRPSSPKPLLYSASSSSTLIASPASSQISNSQVQDVDYENYPPVGSAEWERERWKHWEKIAAQKKAMETGQETLV